MFLFNLNVVFTTHVLKMAQIRVRFSQGFPPGAGCHGEDFALACFERHSGAVKKRRHAGAVKNGAFPTEAALACSQEQNFTERNAPAYFFRHAERTISWGGNRFYVYSWVVQLIQHGAFFYVIVSNHAGANSSP
jgi:hypothetical protein